MTTTTRPQAWQHVATIQYELALLTLSVAVPIEIAHLHQSGGTWGGLDLTKYRDER